MLRKVEGGGGMNLTECINKFFVKGFKPIAYYSKSLDRIYVQLKDCSITERGVTSCYTMMYDTHDSSKVVGIIIENASRFCNTEAVVVDINKWLCQRPEEAVTLILSILCKIKDE